MDHQIDAEAGGKSGLGRAMAEGFERAAIVVRPEEDGRAVSYTHLGYERRYYRQPRYGNICVTSRGDCPTPPLPYGSGCGCNIPGFGPKRGIVQ